MMNRYFASELAVSSQWGMSISIAGLGQVDLFRTVLKSSEVRVPQTLGVYLAVQLKAFLCATVHGPMIKTYDQLATPTTWFQRFTN